MRKTTIIAASLLGLLASNAIAQEPPRRPTPEQMREMRTRQDGAPRVGQNAPLFTLKSLDGQSEFDLSASHGKRPVLLFFGSYT